MKIFISWSGEKGKSIAELLKQWIEKIIQSTNPWISSDIEKGKRWTDAIMSELEQSKFGIICITRDNMDKPWLLFEAGALSNSKDSNVCCFLTDIKPTDLIEPLSLFQLTELNQEDVFKLLKNINLKVKEQYGKDIEHNTLKSLFDTFYPELESGIKEILRKEHDTDEESVVRTDRELLEEAIQLLRDRKQSELSAPRSTKISSELILELIDLYVKEYSLLKHKENIIDVGESEHIDEFMDFLKEKPFLKPTIVVNEQKIKQYIEKHYDGLPF